jgi:hypothetical protein
MALPSCSTLVFALDAAAASTSATSPAFFASMPNPDRMFDVMSAARPRSIPDAVARLRTAGRAAIASDASKPAIPRKVRPSAALLGRELRGGAEILRDVAHRLQILARGAGDRGQPAHLPIERRGNAGDGGAKPDHARHRRSRPPRAPA